MAPSPQESFAHEREEILPHGEAVVISGMSGLYPQAPSIKDLSNVLYNKVNPISKGDYQFKHPEAAKYYGKIDNLNKFDGQFFRVHYRLGSSMDPMARKIFEQTYQAIYDAGLSPDHLSGKKVAVYIGTGFSETESVGLFEKILQTSFGILGCSKTMFANRISYWLNLKGPSVSIEGSCCGGLVALEQAYMDLVSGRCDAAIVGASHIALFPHYSIQYGRSVQLSPDGKTRAFDQNANGLALSDAVTVLFLQRAKDALRIYGEVVNVKNDYTQTRPDELTKRNGYSRDPRICVNFLKNFYEKSGVSPKDVEYVEAFGTGTWEADKLELETIDEVFCKNRREPLLVGSVISNIGHTEASTGITAINKVLLGYEKGLLAANLHCTKPRKDVDAIREGRISILTDHVPCRPSFAAVNVRSVSGISSHVLLRGYHKQINQELCRSSIPQLLTISNRTEAGVKSVINDFKSRPINPEELALMRNIHSRNISGHLGRGYVVLDTQENKTISLGEASEYRDNARRPLWFVYSGMGSQWVGMGSQFMRIPIFAAAIERCHRVLQPKGIDIVHIITSTDKTIYDNIQNCFLGIAAIQIALTDILTHLGLVPDNIIGHSVGEMGCAYADGCLSPEEMILSAYGRGKVSRDVSLIKGSMAAVGIGYKQIRDICPPDIDVACHNGPESCTISGPADSMTAFVTKLTGQGIFAKKVPTSDIAYHSRYIAPAGNDLIKLLEELIKVPKARSEKWLSTSVPQDKWSEPAAKYCSGEYLTNNLLNPVLFEETCQLIPHNAVLVEVAPHGLLQAILKRSLPPSCTNLATAKRGHTDNALFLLQAIGKLYMEGYTPDLQAIYPKVQFPVSTGTPMLSHHAEWSHGEEWEMPEYVTLNKRRAAACKFLISSHDDEHNYIQGNVVGGKVLYPFAASLVCVWDTLMMSLGAPKKSQSVEFSEVHLHAQPELHDQRLLQLNVALNRGNGWFEISNEISKIASGYIKLHNEKETHPHTDTVQTYEHSSNDIYEILHERDYSYSGHFRGIHSVSSSLNEAYLHWRDDWVTHIDSIIQLNTLRRHHDGVSQPVYIRKLGIDVKEHMNKAIKVDEATVVKAEVSSIHDFTKCGGIELNTLRFRDVPYRKDHVFKLLAVAADGDATVADDTDNKEYMSSGHMTLHSENIGNLESLQWVKGCEPSTPGVKVKVHYAGLNYQDIKEATGVIHQKYRTNSYGMDFSGINESGERVMGVVARGACSSEVRARPELLWPVPAHWTLEDAATVPLAYLNAFYCFIDSQKVTRIVNENDKLNVLVHGGAGSLGQAAISIALAWNYEVYTTVSDVKKKKFLLKIFPQLKEENIGNSRDSSFGDMVLNGTKGKGCDIVISGVRGELKDVSLRCSGDSGVTYDMCQLSQQEDYLFGMSNLFRNRSYVSLDLTSLLSQHNSEDIKKLQALMCEGISRGYVRPLSRVTYAPHDAPRAFRLLAASAHRGRVLLHLHHANMLVQPRLSYSPRYCNVLVCDDITLSVHLINRLISRGARKLYIHSVRPMSISHIRKRFWQNIGVQVETSCGDLRDKTVVHQLLNNANNLGPIEGIFVVATKQSDALKDERLTSLLNDMDVVSKSICPDAKYLAVLTTECSTELISRVSRTIKHLHPTLITLPSSEMEVSETQLVSWCCGVLDAFETGIQTNRSVLVVQQRPKQQTTLLQLISQLPGINSEESNDDVTLRDMGLLEGDAKAISTYILNVYNTSLTEQEIFLLNKRKIRDLDQILVPRDFDEVQGLEKFFPCIQEDAVTAGVETIFLPSRARPVITNYDNFGMLEAYLCVIPGLDGNHVRFRQLCERVKLPAIVLQPALDKPHETIQDTARRFAEILINKIGVNSNFYLAGYETGILIAVEIAAILEKHGKEGTVFCIGCTPEGVKLDIQKHLNNYATETELQDAIIQHMLRLMAKADIGILKNALHGKNTWEEKLDTCVRLLKGHITYSKQYAQAVIETAYGRILQACNYASNVGRLKSRIIIMSSPDTSKSIFLTQNLSQKPIAIQELLAPLSRAAKDIRCASIINRYLSPEILEEFENRNWCDIYFDGQNTRFETA